MREPRLVGRERATTTLGDLIANLTHGHGATVGITGAPGTGRTAVLEWAHPAAWASCVPDGIPFGAVTQLLAALWPAARFAELLTECLDDRERAATVLCDAFTSRAAERPLILAVDDLQWADEWSLRWFAAMADRTSSRPILLLASSYEPLAFGTRIPLAPLTEAETAVVAREVLGELGPEALAAVQEVVQGRPAILHELAAEVGVEVGRAPVSSATTHGPVAHFHPGRIAAPGHAQASSPADTSRTPTTHGPATHPHPDRIAAAGHAQAATPADTSRTPTTHGPATHPHPDRIAAAGRSVAVARAARIRRGLPPDAASLLRAMAVCERLGAGAAADLVELPPAAVSAAVRALEASGLIADPRPADVLAELTGPARAELHRRGAELAHRTGAGALVAAELLRAAPPVGEPWARAVLVEAAEQWSAQGNGPAAAEALRRALAEPAGPADRAAVLLRLAAAVVRREPEHADGRLVQVLTELPHLPAATTAADLLLARGDAETTHRLVAATPGDPARAALGWLAREDATGQPEWPGSEDDPAAAGVAAFRLAVRGENRLLALELADRALVVRQDAPLMPRIAACRALLFAGALEPAVDGLTVVVAAARRRDARAAAARALVHRAAAALRVDRPDDALRDLAAADRELPARCWHPAAVPLRLAVEVTAQLRLGRLDHARDVAAEPLPRSDGHGASTAFLLHAEAELALAGDDAGTALAAVLECGRVLRSRGWVNPMVTGWRATAGQALRRLGDTAAAVALVTEEIKLAEHWGTAAELEALRDRAATGSRRAVPLPRPPADPLPAPRFPQRPDALSPAERDVAELAARGLANREIARELSIALRTVELRLTKVYRKLGLKGRTALADRWTTRAPGG